LGKDHPEVGHVLANLAALEAHTGRNREARALFARAIAILSRALGEDHPRVRGCREDLALVADR
jgi:hypothetical protein